ncbi:MAG TPA: ATP phosphoribosyltransferase regulatory subunit [Burkholderiales bacterium]
MTICDRWLLPEGIEETLPSEARRLEALRRRVLDLFDSWGYELVMPPLLEYLDALLTGVGHELDLQTFKVIDQLSGRLMGLRADTTPQAARIDAHYLKRPHATRLCYVGPVLRARPEELAGSREPLQVGAELFGHRGPESDAEVLSLMLAMLALTGIARPHVDLAHVGVFAALVERAGLDAAQREELLEAIERRSRSDVEALLAAWSVASESRREILTLLELSGDDEVLARARREYRTIGGALAAIDNLESIAQQVRAQAPEVALHFDLAELGGYHYYTGVKFFAFVPGEGRAVAKGGRYDGIGRAFGRDRAATGFSADLRRLADLGGLQVPARPAILAPAGDDPALLAEIARLRASGERVLRRLPGDGATAEALGCDRELVEQDGRWQVQAVGAAARS